MKAMAMAGVGACPLSSLTRVTDHKYSLTSLCVPYAGLSSSHSTSVWIKSSNVSSPQCLLKEEGESDKCSSSFPGTISRREVMSLSVGFLLFSGAESALASVTGETKQADEASYALDVDDINAYSYRYPTTYGKASYKLIWVESRKPERYSSAAPLAPDARQRIVSERLDIKDNIVISVSIGPPNYTFLKDTDKTTWDPMDVARSILSDKSTARMTTGQRTTELEIVDARTAQQVDDKPYWYYEYLVQKSPTLSGAREQVYRHSVAVTTERDGYLYSLNASTLSPKWSKLQPMLADIVSSFQLMPPTKEYIPPYKDPWRFW